MSSDESFNAILPLLRQLREIKGVREARPGEFQCRSQPFIRLVDTGNQPVAELRKRGAGGFDRFAIDTPPAQRKLLDEAKRRAAAMDDD